jgi:LAO/AO transport system kinase
VFFSSVGPGVSLGGGALATAGLVQVFDAVGFEVIMVETVGAGQSEVDIARLAHTTLVVEAPGLGDDIQAIKAGILEIADILAVNKADRPGVENTLKALKGALELAHPVRHVFRHHGKMETVEAPDAPVYNSWIPPIQKTVATTGEGIPELAAEIARHVEHLRQSGDWAARERSRLRSELDALLREALFARFREQVKETRYEEALERVFRRSLAPGEAVKILLNGWSK